MRSALGRSLMQPSEPNSSRRRARRSNNRSPWQAVIRQAHTSDFSLNHVMLIELNTGFPSVHPPSKSGVTLSRKNRAQFGCNELLLAMV